MRLVVKDQAELLETGLQRRRAIHETFRVVDLYDRLAKVDFL